jgi:hypothetical protein
MVELLILACLVVLEDSSRSRSWCCLVKLLDLTQMLVTGGWLVICNTIHRKAELGHLHSGWLIVIELVTFLLLDLVGLPGQDTGDIQVGDQGIPGCRFGDEWAAAKDSVGGPATDFDDAP